MTRLSTVELLQDAFSFSAGHFTIFSATERENLHGHNYHVNLEMKVDLGNDGLAFDYRIYKKKLMTICEGLNHRFLLPDRSKHLRIEDAGDMWIAHFDQDRIPFLKKDVIILPICNVTIEELSYWFLQQLTVNQTELASHHILEITVRVFNGPGQASAAYWKK